MIENLKQYLKLLTEATAQHSAMKQPLEELINEINQALQAETTLSQKIELMQRGQRLIDICDSQAYENVELMSLLENQSEPLWQQIPPLPNVSEELLHSLAKQMFISNGVKKDTKNIISVCQEGRGVLEHLIPMFDAEEIPFKLRFREHQRITHFINHLSPESLKKFAQSQIRAKLDADKIINISTNVPTEIAQNTDKEKSREYQRYMKPVSERAMCGKMHFTLTKIPTEADAQADNFSYPDYVTLFFELCNQPWQVVKESQAKLIEQFNKAKKLYIENNDGTSITMSIDGKTFANSVVARNVPGSEIFSSPIVDHVDGKIVAKGKFCYRSTGIIENITLVFKEGKIVEFDAEKGLDALTTIITADDEGSCASRKVGEIGIGTNPHLRFHSVNGLLVEKISGSFHVAIGSCYTSLEYDGVQVYVGNGNKSESSVHWDITTILRDRGGKMVLDDDLVIQEDGKWIGEEYRVLNEGWGALPEDQQPDWWKERYPNGYN